MKGKISQDVIDAINKISPETLMAHGALKQARIGYICPLCGNGAGKDGTGISPLVDTSHVGWHCHKCGESFNNMEILARHYGLNKRTDFQQLVESICADFRIDITRDEPDKATEKKSAVPPAVLNAINDDLNADIQPLKAFVAAQGGTWRGLPLEILERFGCRYIPNWTPPKSRANQTYATPTPRMIIPANADGLHSNYLARLTVPINSFNEKEQKFLREKEHAGIKTLFNPDALSADVVFAVEGPVDAISIEFAGFRAVAVGGADSYRLLVDAVATLEKKPCVIVFFDADDTGEKYAPKLQRALNQVGCKAVIRFICDNDEYRFDANQALVADPNYFKDKLSEIRQDAMKEFATLRDETPPETSSRREEKNSPSKAKNPAAIKFTFEQKKFLYSGDFSDVGFADRIDFMYHDRIRYLQDENSWLILDRNEQGGGIWKNRGEKKAVIEPFARQLSDALITNADPEPEPVKNSDGSIKHAANDDIQKKFDLHKYQVSLGKHLRKQKNVSQAIEAMKGIESLIIHPEDLNKPKHLLNVLNGVVDLQTGELLPLDPDYLIMNQAGAAYDPDADTSFVEKFLADILPDADTRRAGLRYLGYCLTGEKNFHISEFWRGNTGANGKSTLIDFVMKVFGSYAKKLPAAGLLENRRPVDGNSATPAIAQLDGDIRLAIIDELPRNVRLDAALFKTLTGDETVYSRALYCSPRIIELRAKFIINGNHLPTFDVDDGGLERRITNIPFNQKFTGSRADSKLAQKLSTPENLSALLKLLVDEAKEYYVDGLLESDEMKAAKAEYFSENDFVGNFVEEKCEVGDGGEITRKAFEEKLSAEYPRECARLKKKELLDLIISRLAPLGVAYTQNRTKCNVFKNIRWLDSEE